MKVAPLPESENERLKTLLAYKVLDTPAEISLDDLTELASAICGTPIAAISLIDKNRQWFKSSKGLPEGVTETPRDISFCGHAIVEHEVFVVNDTHIDERFHDNPLVTGELSVRFYAGAQLVAPNGETIGSLCVLDSKPNALTETQRLGLAKLAKQVMAQLELREANRRIAEQFNALQESTQLVMDYQRKLAEHSRLVTIEQMSAGVSHEINNPLAIVSGYIELLQSKFESPHGVDHEAVCRDLKIMMSTCERIAKIVKGLKTFARDSSSDPFYEVKAETVIQDTLLLCAARFRDRNIEVTVDAGDALLHCRAAQISQVLINLLNNASDSISSISGKRWVKIRAESQSDGTLVSVTDSGLGIPEATASKMMQPFFTTKDVGSGMGLGLSIACGVAKSHGGFLKLDSSCPNTKFDLYIPNRVNKPILKSA